MSWNVRREAPSGLGDRCHDQSGHPCGGGGSRGCGGCGGRGVRSWCLLRRLRGCLDFHFCGLRSYVWSAEYFYGGRCGDVGGVGSGEDTCCDRLSCGEGGWGLVIMLVVYHLLRIAFVEKRNNGRS